MLLFGFRCCPAVRSQFDAHNQNDLILESGQQKRDFPGDKPKKELPDCYDIAKATYPGGCDPEQSGFACYSKERVFQDVPVHWACSKELDQTDISDEKCPLRPWHFKGEANGKHLNFTAPAGIYAGACQFSLLPPEEESTKAATTPEKAKVVATTTGERTVAATTPQKPTAPQKPTEVATTPEQPTEGATTPEQSTEAATTPEKSSVVATTLEESTKAATTPEQSTKAATTLEESTKAATTPEQLTDDTTTPMQPESGPTTLKSGAASNSVGSLLTTIFGLSLYSLH